MNRAKEAGQLRLDVGVGDVMVAVAQLSQPRLRQRRPLRAPSSAAPAAAGRAAGSGPIRPAGHGRDHGGPPPSLMVLLSAQGMPVAKISSGRRDDSQLDVSSADGWPLGVRPGRRSVARLVRAHPPAGR
jgi:hypothetical protein